MKLPLSLGAVAILAAAILVPAAPASNLIDRNATGVRLSVDRSGTAVLTYRTGGKLKHVLAWEAENAIFPTTTRPQTAFKLDYSGGWALSHQLPLRWQTLRNACGVYHGAALPWLVAACTAPDGSNWAVQSWQRMLPNYGLAPSDASQSVRELRLSHWQGDLPAFAVNQDWAYRRYDNLFGSFTYLGQPMFGFRTNAQGAPLDNYGVLIYLDTLNSAYGAGWKRENSFVTHNPTGVFCYGFFPHGARPSGMGEAYRATVVGPGVLPDLMWQGTTPGPYDRDRDLQADALRQQSFHDKLCSYN